MKKLIVSSVAAACFFGTVSVEAKEVEVRVSHADLDLSNGRDLTRLRKRVRSAILDACAPSAGEHTLFGNKSCFTNAMADAELQISSLRERAATPTLVAKN